MPAVLFDITAEQAFFRGEDRTIEFTIVKEDNVTPWDITAWTLTFRVAPTQYGPATITKTPTKTDPTNGVCEVSLSSSDTFALAQDGIDTTYYYDLRRTDNGSRAELVYGSLLVRDTYTDS